MILLILFALIVIKKVIYSVNHV